MAFEKFDKATGVAANKPMEIAVNIDGVISLTWRGYEALGEPTYVEFFYDRDRGLAALGSAQDERNAYQVRRPRASGPDGKGRVSVRGATFLKFYNLEQLTRLTRVEPEVFVEDGLLCFPIAPLDRPTSETEIANDTEASDV